MNSTDPKRPGYYLGLFDVNLRNTERMANKILDFICRGYWRRDWMYADIGPANPKMTIIKECLHIEVEQIDTDNFNFDLLPRHRYYDAIFCFETIEHLQNPLFLMAEIKRLLAPDGVIFLSTPCNPRFLMFDCHYNEMSRKHLEKWILTPLGLKIVRHKRFNFVNNWKAIFIGIRPLIRAIRTLDFRPILWQLVYVNNLYEVTHDR